VPTVDDLSNLLHRTEELHEDLRPYVETGTVWLMLRHPLVFSVPYHTQMNAFLNAQYLQKKKRIDQAMVDGEYDRYIGLHERPYRLMAFESIQRDLKANDYWKMVNFIWVDSENIFQNIATWQIVWRRRVTTRGLVMDDAELEALAKLPDVVTIYRGVQQERTVKGLSWTLDRDKAVWFARRFRDKRPRLAQTVVTRSHILAHFLGRNEQEIVVLPSLIRSIHIEKL
jgi:hypothetical protein